MVPARPAAVVLPLRLAAAGPDPGHRRPVLRTPGPVAAPARHHPALPHPDVGRGARPQRGGPAAGQPRRDVLRRLHGRRAAAADGPVDGGEGGLHRSPGADPQRPRPGRRTRRPRAPPDLPRGRGRRARRARQRDRTPRPGDRRQRAGGRSRHGRGDVLADAPLLLAGAAGTAQHARGAGLHLGTGGPRLLHRRRRPAPGALLPDGDRARPHRVQRGDDPARRRPDGGDDPRPPDPRGRRPVDAALRPAARPGGVVGADLRAAPGGRLR